MIPQPSLATGATGRQTVAEDWPMFHHDLAHTGVSSEVTLGASNAPGLKVHWKAALGTKSYSSPAVVFNQTLGKTVVYVGNQAGSLSAWDATSGAPVWAFKAPKSIQTSPTLYNGTVYFGDSDHNLYAVNATTGKLVCKFPTSGIISSSPVVVDPDGTGPVAYFGDSGPSGSLSDGGHVWAVNAVGNSAGACTLKWSFDNYGSPPGNQTGNVGTYDVPAFGHDQTGRPVIVFGSTDNDDAVYSVDARDGTEIWRFQTKVVFDSDVGASPTIAPPGANGVAGGLVYVTGKDAVVYAINLTTGLLKWQFSLTAQVGSKATPSQSTATLQGNVIYLGFGEGMFALNATTGAKIWQSVPGQAVMSSPAMGGAASDQVLFAGDMAGNINAFSAATGKILFQTSTAGFIWGSAAVSTGQAFIASTDGFLYAIGT